MSHSAGKRRREDASEESDSASDTSSSSGDETSGSESEDDETKEDHDERDLNEPVEPVLDGRQLTLELRSLTLLVCKLCDGYFRDAHTITECLHTFCKTCLLNHFALQERSEHKFSCPQCQLQLETTEPLRTSLRLDRVMQNLVDKIMPQWGAADDELRQRIFGAFRKAGTGTAKQTGVPASSEEQTEEDAAAAFAAQKFRSGDSIIFELRPEKSSTSSSSSAAAANANSTALAPLEQPIIRTAHSLTIRHLKKYLAHLQIVPSFKEVDITLHGEVLGVEHSLYFVKKTRWSKRDGMLALTYRRRLIS